MPFLFYENNQFTFMEERQRQGLIIQHYSKQGLSRPLSLFPAPFDSYHCVLRSSSIYNAVIKNNKNQVYLLEYNGKEIHRTLLLEDPKNLYQFSSPQLGLLQKELHFFYLATSGEKSSLLHQNLTKSSSLNTLVTDLSSCLMKVYSTPQGIYIFYTNQKDHFYLHCIKISHTTESFTLLTTDTPISDFNVCFEGNFLHILYVKELYGKKQLVYTNTRHFKPINLCFVQGECNPSLLFYEEMLWVSYRDQQSLYHMLSLDFGSHFTAPIQSENTNALLFYHFTSKHPSLNSYQLYASTYPYLRLLPIDQIDVYGIHPELPTNAPLALLLKTFKQTLSHIPPAPSYSAPSRANTPPPPTFTNPTTPKPPIPPTNASHSTLNTVSETPPSPLSVKDAAKAFMNQFNQFDAQPLDRE